MRVFAHKLTSYRRGNDTWKYVIVRYPFRKPFRLCKASSIREFPHVARKVVFLDYPKPFCAAPLSLLYQRRIRVFLLVISLVEKAMADSDNVVEKAKARGLKDMRTWQR